jgi:hypothetical protein
MRGRVIAALVFAACPESAQAPQPGGQTGEAQTQLRFQPVTRPSGTVAA